MLKTLQIFSRFVEDFVQIGGVEIACIVKHILFKLEAVSSHSKNI